MDLLQRLATPVRRIAAAILVVLGVAIWTLSIAIEVLFGQVEWHAPAWLSALRRLLAAAWRWLRAHRRLALQASSAVVIITAALIAGKWWYDSRPHPVEVSFHVTDPPITRYEATGANPSPVTVRFSASTAPLNLVGKEIPAGIAMRPKMAGRWLWDDDRTLRFEPKADWPVGEEYSVDLDHEKLAAPHVLLASYGFKFKTAPFNAHIQKAEFYQDPVEPALKKVVVTVRFSHPVDPAALEKRVTMSMEGEPTSLLGLAPGLKYNVIYDKLKLTAYIHSDRLEIPVKSTRLLTRIADGITAAQGGKGTSAALDQAVGVPGLYSLSVTGTELTLVDNERLEPEQVMLVSTSADVSEKDMATSVTARVLPLYHPDQKPEERKTPFAWYDPAKVPEKVLGQSTPLKLEAIPAERDQASRHGFKYQADVGRYVYVRIKKGVRSFGGYLMGRDHDQIVRVPPYPEELKILHSGSLLALSGERKLSVFTRDIAALRVEMGRVLPTQLQHLVTQSSGEFGQPQFQSGEFREENIAERFTQVIELPQLAAGKPHYQAVDLSGYLDAADGSRRGIFFTRVEAWDAKEKRATGKQDARFVVITDLGLLIKRSLDGSQDVFVQSIHAGTPVSGATVEVVGRNGLPVLSQTTDANGHARFPSLHDFHREQEPALYLVRKGGDMSFLPLNRNERSLNFSRFDVGGVANTVQSDAMSAYLFSDRGMYRPGDEMHVGMIVRAADWTRSLVGLPLEATVTDPRGLVVKREKLKLSAMGFEALSYTTQETSPTGTYSVNLYIVRDGQPGGQIGATTVRVQEFQPDRMKMSVRLSSEAVEGWVSPKDLKARVNLQNLFGTPAAERRVIADMTLSPAYPSFSAFRDYRFYDPQRAKQTFTERLPDARTDAGGEAQFDLNLNRFAAATYRLSVVAQGFEAEGGRGVTAETGTLVSELPYLIGYKPDGELGYVSLGAKRQVQFVAIDPRAQRTAVDKLTLSRIERRYVSVLTRHESGTWRYESKLKEVGLETQPFAIAASGSAFALPTADAGDFSLVLRNADGGELARVEYSVAGRANVTRSLEKNAELQITLNKRDYAPGEEIELQIKAPYTGAGLITIEREKVFQHQWFKTSTTSSVQRIRLPSGLEGNGYVSVAFIRDPGSEEIYASPLSYGVVPFSVSLEQKRTEVSVTTPELVKPGEDLRLRYRTDAPSRIVVFAVDEGILQVAGYRNADPLAYFFQKRSLQVKTSQILDLILPEFSRLTALSAPGGDAEAAIGKHLNPFKRKRDKPVVYWSGIIDAGPDERELTYPIPDYFNGTLRIMAVAVGPRAMGVFEKKAVVRGDFVLSPNAPTTVAPGDEFEVSVGVANNVQGSGSSAAVNVAVQPSAHLEVLGPAKTELKIGEMREAATIFRLRARDKLGAASLQFTASLSGKSSRATVGLSVRPAIPYRTDLAVGNFKQHTYDVRVTRDMYAEHRTLEASVSVLPLAMAHGLVSYLGNFSYSCTEQLVSQGMPAAVLRERPEFGYVKPAAGQGIDGLIATLRSRQNAEGAYALWAANQYVSEFASVYAQHFLIEARERGIIVPQDMLTSSNNYLQQLAGSEGGSLFDERTRAYAVYVLTRQGMVTSELAAAVQKRLERSYQKEWRQDLAAGYLAASYQLMKQERLADGLIGDLKLGEKRHGRFAQYYDNVVHDAVVLYLTARHFPSRLQRVPPAALEAMAGYIQSGSYNTLSSAYLLLAFDAYARATSNVPGATFTVAEVLKDGKARALKLPGGLMPKVAFTSEAAQVRFGKDSDIGGFYLVNQSGFDRALPGKEIKNGLEVLREYTGADGKPISTVKLGEEIEVHLKFRALSGPVSDLAIVDLLPGGFEVVEEPVTTNRTERAVYQPRTQTAPAEGEEGSSSDESASSQESDEGAESANPPEESSDESSGGGWRAPVGTSKSTWQPEYADVREDRIVLYGTAQDTVSEFVYRIKATNVGTYVVPPTFGESMYDRSIQGRSLGGKLIVERK
jgi:uncharacterized protein YfaS (alpha-2-macroglobulin family)